MLCYSLYSVAKAHEDSGGPSQAVPLVDGPSHRLRLSICDLFPFCYCDFVSAIFLEALWRAAPTARGVPAAMHLSSVPRPVQCRSVSVGLHLFATKEVFIRAPAKDSAGNPDPRATGKAAKRPLVRNVLEWCAAAKQQRKLRCHWSAYPCELV